MTLKMSYYELALTCYSILELLSGGHRVSIPLRSPTVLEQDAAMKEFVDNNQATLHKCDAMKFEDVANAWNTVNDRTPVDLVLFCVGMHSIRCCFSSYQLV